MSCQRVHTPVLQRPFAFLLRGSPNSLVTRDHKEVCPLSCRMMLQPVSVRLQDSIRFFLVPLPALRGRPLRFTCPVRWAKIRAYRVPRNEYAYDLDPALFTGGSCRQCDSIAKGDHLPTYLLVQARCC
jgi:hypothetical protein